MEDTCKQCKYLKYNAWCYARPPVIVSYSVDNSGIPHVKSNYVPTKPSNLACGLFTRKARLKIHVKR